MVVAPSIPLADPDTLVRVSGVSKKFCLSLKKSLWYGLCDMGRELTGRRRGEHGGLRTKEFWAVNNVSFELKRGECLGLIGRNGAGKTTLLKMLNGLIKPDAGRIEMRGRVGALIALGAGFNPILTGRENIYVNGSVLGLTKKEIGAKLDEIVDFAEIGDFIDTPVQNYSSGMAVRLGFAVASSIRPDVLLIDEVLAVGDISFVLRCLNRVSELLPTTAVVFVSHNMQFVSRICTCALLMDHGNIEYAGDDVAFAIERYSKTTLTFQRQSVGGTDLQLAGIGLRTGPQQDFEDSSTLNLPAGSPLEIRIEFKSTVPIALKIRPWVKIYDGQMREIADLGPMPATQCYHVAPRGRIILQLVVAPLHLNAGMYSIVVGASDESNQRNYARINNCAEFYVQSDYHGWAACIVPGQWSQIT